jgi:lysozyme family protein
MAPQPRFYFCLDFVLGREGGYSDHPADRGGATNYGVTQGLYDSVRASLGEPQQAVRLITEVEVRYIYEREFWRPPRCHLMTPPLDLLLFDSAVQHGAGRAAKLLQSVVGAFQDGAIGPKTMGAVTEFERRKGIAGLVRVYVARRRMFYADIIRNDPSQKVFEKGWENRLNATQAACEKEL